MSRTLAAGPAPGRGCGSHLSSPPAGFRLLTWPVGVPHPRSAHSSSCTQASADTCRPPAATSPTPGPTGPGRGQPARAPHRGASGGACPPARAGPMHLLPLLPPVVWGAVAPAPGHFRKFPRGLGVWWERGATSVTIPAWLGPRTNRRAQPPAPRPRTLARNGLVRAPAPSAAGRPGLAPGCLPHDWGPSEGAVGSDG